RIAAGARPRPASYSWPLLEWWRAAAAAAPVEAAGAVVEAAEVGAQLLLSPQPSQSRAPAQPTTSSTRRRSCSPSNSLSPGTPPESRRFGIGILIGGLVVVPGDWRLAVGILQKGGASSPPFFPLGGCRRICFSFKSEMALLTSHFTRRSSPLCHPESPRFVRDEGSAFRFWRLLDLGSQQSHLKFQIVWEPATVYRSLLRSNVVSACWPSGVSISTLSAVASILSASN